MYTSQCTLVKRRIGDQRKTRLLELMLMYTKDLSPRKQRFKKHPALPFLELRPGDEQPELMPPDWSR